MADSNALRSAPEPDRWAPALIPHEMEHVRTRETATGAPPETGTFPAPYPPSWFDRLTAWVDRLPGPAWAFYLIISVGLALALSVVQWSEGAYPIGTFNVAHLFTGASLGYMFGLMHYLDKAASSAIESFRPLLPGTNGAGGVSDEEQSAFDALCYRLVTLPPWPAFLTTVAGVAFVSVLYAVDLVSGNYQPYLDGTAGTAFSTVAFMTIFVPANALLFLLGYHTVHQLRHISRIYTRYAQINIYQLDPLYALSLPGAFTALGIMVWLYGLFAITPADALANPVQIGLSVVFAGVAALTFGLPLLGAHRRLVAAKKTGLGEVSSRFKAVTIELHRQLDSGNLVQMDQLNKALASLQMEQDVLRKIPTWPWEPGTLRALVAALFLPVVVWAIQTLLARFLGV